MEPIAMSSWVGHSRCVTQGYREVLRQYQCSDTANAFHQETTADKSLAKKLDHYE